MNRETQQAAIDIIESRLSARIDAMHKPQCSKSQIEGELTMTIDMAHMFGAIGLDEQRHYKERLARIIENDNRQWAEQHRRIM